VAGATVGGRRPPTAGGRDLPEEFTFKTFCDWIRHELEEELRRRWKIKANGLECQHHRQRPRADRGQPTARQLAVSDSFRQIPSKSG